jgi:hypothetical protein
VIWAISPVVSALNDEAIITAAGGFPQPNYCTSVSSSNMGFVPQLKIGLSFITFNGLFLRITIDVVSYP